MPAAGVLSTKSKGCRQRVLLAVMLPREVYFLPSVLLSILNVACKLVQAAYQFNKCLPAWIAPLKYSIEMGTILILSITDAAVLVITGKLKSK